jgi:excisionase family DNA binding protein
MPVETADKLLLSPAEVAGLLGISRAKLFTMLACGQLPPSLKLGGQRKWRRDVVEKWVELDCPNLERFLVLTGGTENDK